MGHNRVTMQNKVLHIAWSIAIGCKDDTWVREFRTVEKMLKKKNKPEKTAKKYPTKTQPNRNNQPTFSQEMYFSQIEDFSEKLDRGSVHFWVW